MCSRIRAICFLCFVLCACIPFASAKKAHNWPPRLVIDHFDFPTAIHKCMDLHKPDVKKMEEFELTDNFDHLPDDRSIKCYMHCQYMEFGIMKPDSQVMDWAHFVGVMNMMEPEEQSTYLKMGKKCNKIKNKDLCELVYQFQVCVKKNDNEHYYLFYDDKWLYQ